MIEKCLRCGYSQKGLPTEHRCPECGLAYDKFVQVVRFPRHMLELQNELGVYSVLTFFLFRQLFPAVSPIYPLSLLGVLGLLLAGYDRAMVGRFHGVASLPDFLFEFGKFTQWDEFASAEPAKTMPGVLLRRKNLGDMKIMEGFASRAQALKFARSANARIRNETKQHDIVDADFSAEDHVRVIKLKNTPRRPWMGWLLRMNLLFVAGILALELSLTGAFWVMPVGGVVLVAHELYWRKLGPKDAQQLLLNSKGIILERGEEQLFNLQWSDVKSAYIKQGSFCLSGERGPIFQWDRSALGAKKRMEDCVDEINRLKAVYDPSDKTAQAT